MCQTFFLRYLRLLSQQSSRGTTALKQPKKKGREKSFPLSSHLLHHDFLLHIRHLVSEADSPCNSQQQSHLPFTVREKACQKDMDTHPLLSPAVLLEQDTNQFHFQQVRELYVSHPPCFPPTICLPHRSVESHRISQRGREHGNRLVNTSSHLPTKKVSQPNRNVW